MARSYRSAVAGAFALLVAVAALSSTGPAIAQQVKAVTAQIVNDRNHPVPVAIVRGERTAILLDRSLSGTSGPIDARSFGRIRVIASNSNTITACTITPYAEFGDSLNDLVALGSSLNPALFEARTAVYDFPGPTLRIHVSGCTAHVVVYGRAD